MRTWLAVAALVLIVIVAFRPALDNGFVNWDDDKNFLENPFYRGLGGAEVKWAWSTFWFGVYQPLAWLLFELQYICCKLDPRGYHLTSIVLHAANTVVLYVLAVTVVARCQPDYCLNSPWTCSVGAGLATALFAVHPLRVEAVAWASCQPYLPCALFSMLAVLSYFHAFGRGPSPDSRWLLAAFVLFVAALLFKAAAVSVPALLLILDVYPLRRFGQGPGRWFAPKARRIWYEKVPFVVVSVLFMGLAIAARRRAVVSTEQNGASASVAQVCYGIWFYIVKTVLPQDLVAVYPSPREIDWLAWPFMLSILATLIVSGGLYLWRRQWPGLLAAWLSYVVILAPHLGIIRISDQIAADRFSYMAILSWFMVASVCFCQLAQRSSRLRPEAIGIITLGVAALVALIPMTWNQCGTWRDSNTLWAHSLSHGSGDSSQVHNNIGVELASQGKFDAAIGCYTKALRLDPRYAHARNNLGVALSRLGKSGAAVTQYAEAIRLRPAYVDAHNNLGVELTHMGEFDAAATHFEVALRLDPEYVPAYNNLGVALVSQGKFGAAATRYAEALGLNPSFGDAYNNLALIMAACPEANYRDGRQAVELATRACELAEWKSSEFLNTLAAAWAESGDFDSAFTCQMRAIESLTDARKHNDYRSRLALYQAKKPYRMVFPGRPRTEVRP